MKTITKSGLENSSTKLLQKDDIIISARGTVGAMAQVTRPMAFNQSCYGLRAKGRVTTDYLFYVLKYQIQQLKSIATGSKFDAITTTTFREVKLPVPDDKTQKKIVAECNAVDNSAAQLIGEGIALANVHGEMTKRKEAILKKYL
jgi:restriction endonuclease S subunit